MRSGFTLVEVLVAVGIACLLLTGVVASTQSTIRTIARAQADERREECRSRAIELLREDWRGRTKVLRPTPAPPDGVQAFNLLTTADSVGAERQRGGTLVSYRISDQGLSRAEGGSRLDLLPGPVKVQFWDGMRWQETLPAKTLGLQVLLAGPAETVVLR